jgi:hypothetical protein
MNDIRSDATLGRRDMIARLAAVALSFTGLTAFKRFTPSTDAGTGTAAAPKWDDRFELAVDLEIAPPQGGRWHRPYVAVWIEDASGKPVRTLTAWLNTEGRGPRYFKELAAGSRSSVTSRTPAAPISSPPCRARRAIRVSTR